MSRNIKEYRESRCFLLTMGEGQSTLLRGQVDPEDHYIKWDAIDNDLGLPRNSFVYGEFVQEVLCPIDSTEMPSKLN